MNKMILTSGLLVVIGLSQCLVHGLYVSEYRPGCQPGSSNLHFDDEVAPNAIFQLLTSLELYHLMDFNFYHGDELPGLAARQASQIPLGLRQQLARHTPLMSLLIEALEQFADMSGKSQDVLEICDAKCRQNIQNYYIKRRPTIRRDDYEIHAEMGHLVADDLAKRIAGFPNAPELTNDLLDEVYDELANYRQSYKTTGVLNLEVFKLLEKETSYRSHHSTVFVARLNRIYQNYCADLPADFPKEYENLWLKQMKASSKMFTKDGSIVWTEDEPSGGARVEPPIVSRPSITRPKVKRPEVEMGPDSKVPDLFSR